jgi:hypothetical protein
VRWHHLLQTFTLPLGRKRLTASEEPPKKIIIRVATNK